MNNEVTKDYLLGVRDTLIVVSIPLIIALIGVLTL